MGHNQSLPLATALIEPMLLRDKEAAEMVGLSVRRFWQLVAAGEMPPPVRLPGRATRWRTSDIRQWVDGLSVRRIADNYPRQETLRATALARSNMSAQLGAVLRKASNL